MHTRWSLGRLAPYSEWVWFMYLMYAGPMLVLHSTLVLYSSSFNSLLQHSIQWKSHQWLSHVTLLKHWLSTGTSRNHLFLEAWKVHVHPGISFQDVFICRVTARVTCIVTTDTRSRMGSGRLQWWESHLAQAKEKDLWRAYSGDESTLSCFGVLRVSFAMHWGTVMASSGKIKSNLSAPRGGASLRAVCCWWSSALSPVPWWLLGWKIEWES